MKAGKILRQTKCFATVIVSGMCGLDPTVYTFRTKRNYIKWLQGIANIATTRIDILENMVEQLTNDEAGEIRFDVLAWEEI